MLSAVAYRSPPNLLPSKFSTCNARDDYFALAVKAHNLHTNRASSAALNFVLVTEEIDTRLTAAIV